MRVSWVLIILLMGVQRPGGTHVGPPTWHLAQGWALCPKAIVCTVTYNPHLRRGAAHSQGVHPGASAVSYAFQPSSSQPPRPVCGHQGWLGWAQTVFSLRVTSRVGMSQDRAFGHTRPQEQILTKPSRATSLPAPGEQVEWALQSQGGA